MLLKEIVTESVVTTNSALDQLVYNTNKLQALYAGVLLDQVQRMYAAGDHEDMYRTVKNVLGRLKGKWFAENYLSTSTSRENPTTGLKNALLAVAKDPLFKSIARDIHELGSFRLNLSTQVQRETAMSSSKYVDQLAETLPFLLDQLSKLAPQSFREKLKTTAIRLENAVDHFDATFDRIHKEWDESWGPGAESAAERARAERERTNRKEIGGGQANQAEQLVSQVLSTLDKKVAAEIRPIVMRSDNKLATLQQELTKRGIQI